MNVLNWNCCDEIYEIISSASEDNLNSEGIQLLDETITALTSASDKLYQLANYIANNQSKRYQVRHRENQEKQIENQEQQTENQDIKESSRSSQFKIYIKASTPNLTKDKVESFLKSIGVLEYAIHIHKQKGKYTSGIIIVQDREFYVKILKERCTFKVGNKPVYITPNTDKKWR